MLAVDEVGLEQQVLGVVAAQRQFRRQQQGRAGGMRCMRRVDDLLGVAAQVADDVAWPARVAASSRVQPRDRRSSRTRSPRFSGST